MERPDKRVNFELKCERCKYKYNVYAKRYEIESCPICGYKAELQKFIEEAKDVS